jgi:hypothetical protein
VNPRIALLAVAIAGLAAGCSSTSSSGSTAASTTTSLDPAATTTTPLALTTTTGPAASTTVVVTVAPTVAPAPPAATVPKPPTATAAPAPAGPTLSSVRLRDPLPSCNPGDALTITILFNTANAAGVTVWSSYDGDLGQFPAEYGTVEVPYICVTGQALYTLYPVAEGGGLGNPVDLYV